MYRRRLRSLLAFTLVETLIVVAILGLLIAIGVPMWLNTINRARQSQTLANMREIAGAWEMRAADFKSYNAAGATFTMPATPMKADDVEKLISPTYIRAMPRFDGWRRALDFATDSVKGGPATQYAIRSMGRDGKLDGGKKKKYTMGTTKRFDCDIIYSTGVFVVYPAGVQKN